jgi:hypothetical protein
MLEFHKLKLFQAGERILCRHPFIESKRAYVVPQRVEELVQCYWPGKSSMNIFPSSKNFVCSHKHVTDFQKLVIKSGVSASDYLEFMFFLHKFFKQHHTYDDSCDTLKS